MRRITIALAAILFTMSSAGAVDDWEGVVKVQAAYGTQTGSTAPQINIAVDVTYDRPGPSGKAWGILSYGRPKTASSPTSRVYAHALCVGVFNSGNKAVVTGRVVKSFGAAFPAFLSFEFDVANKRLRAFGHATEAEAKANCGELTGIFPVQFNFGYVIVQ